MLYMLLNAVLLLPTRDPRDEMKSLFAVPTDWKSELLSEQAVVRVSSVCSFTAIGRLTDGRGMDIESRAVGESFQRVILFGFDRSAPPQAWSTAVSLSVSLVLTEWGCIHSHLVDS